MTLGVGGSTFAVELDRLRQLVGEIPTISHDEYRKRIKAAQAKMKEKGIEALFLDASKNLSYFTGMSISVTERLHGALLPADGEIAYLSPTFEIPKTREMLILEGDVRGWEEHEDPTALALDMLAGMGISQGAIGLDPQTRFFTVEGFRRGGNRYDFVNGSVITAACRSRKSDSEIAIIKYLNDITLEVHRSVAAVLYDGMSARQLRAFAVEAFAVFGAVLPGGLFLFGPGTAYPHGVPYDQKLSEGEMVLVDMSCELGGYRSDITRSYVFGTPTERQRFLWSVEQEAQATAFSAAKLGVPIEEIDYAARRVLGKAGFSSDYATPGLPHRTGHGIGMDVHEEEYIVRGNRTALAAGMCFTIEPTICIYDECGIRLEDCAYAAEDGVHWFTEPAKFMDNPFNLS